MSLKTKCEKRSGSAQLPQRTLTVLLPAPLCLLAEMILISPLEMVPVHFTVFFLTSIWAPASDPRRPNRFVF